MLFSTRFLSRGAISSSLFRNPRILPCCTQPRCEGTPFSSTSRLTTRALYATHGAQESSYRPSDQFRSPPRKKTKPPSGATKKGRGDIELFDAIVHDGTPVYKIRQHVGEVCVQQDGSAADLKLDEDLVDKLQKCYETSDASGAVKILECIHDEGLAPTAGAFLRVIEICATSAQFDLAEGVLEHFKPLHGVYESPDAVQCAAKSAIALSYLGNDRPMDALQVAWIFR